MKVMNSYSFLDDETGMASVVTEPNEESMEYAHVECVLAKKSTMCAHLFHVV